MKKVNEARNGKNWLAVLFVVVFKEAAATLPELKQNTETQTEGGGSGC